MGGCKTALHENRYNWRHDLILAVLLNFIKTAKTIKIHCDIEVHMNPSVITGEENLPNMIVTQHESTVFVLELSVGFETNIDLNTKRKANKYKEMLKSLENKFEKVNFVNQLMRALGIVGAHSSIINMLKALVFRQQEIAYLIKRITLLYNRNVLFILYQEEGMESAFSSFPITAHFTLCASWTPCLIQVSNALKGSVIELLFSKIK